MANPREGLEISNQHFKLLLLTGLKLLLTLFPFSNETIWVCHVAFSLPSPAECLKGKSQGVLTQLGTDVHLVDSFN